MSGKFRWGGLNILFSGPKRPPRYSLTQNCYFVKLFRKSFFFSAELTNFTRNFSKSLSFPEVWRAQNPSKIAKNIP